MQRTNSRPIGDRPSITTPNGASYCGRYRLFSRIASGGMASVYLARSEGPDGFGKLVALKRIHPAFSKEKDFVDMFRDEARIASLLSHPNVCAVTDFGEADGSYFLTMEYLVGEPLSHVERRMHVLAECVPPEVRVAFACRVLADAAEGLHAAHELVDPSGRPLHVIHRDVSPSNVIVTYDGGVRVVDFGIAHAVARRHHTATGLVKGKLAYMSPERFVGGTVDRRADVWSLGVVLHEMLTGSPLFGRPSGSHTMTAVLEDRVPALSGVVPGVTRELDAILARALDRDLADRYPTARAFARDLGKYVAARGLVFGLAEIAEHMHELFPHGLARHQACIALAVGDGAGSGANARCESGEYAARRDALPEDETAVAVPVTDATTPRVPADVVALFATAETTKIARAADVERLRLSTADSGAVRPDRASDDVSVISLTERRTARHRVSRPAGRSVEDTSKRPSPPPRPEAPRLWIDEEPAPRAARTSYLGVIAAIVLAPLLAISIVAFEPADEGRAATGMRSDEPTTVTGTTHEVAPVPAFGRVTLVTDGVPADVRFGDVQLGVAPGTFSLPVGRHVLTLVLANGTGRVLSVIVDVREGITERVRVGDVDAERGGSEGGGSERGRSERGSSEREGSERGGGGPPRSVSPAASASR